MLFFQLKFAPINEEETKNISFALENSKWELTKQMVSVKNGQFSMLEFTLYLKREGSNYGFIYILPIVVLALVTCIYLFLRPVGIAKYITGKATFLIPLTQAFR